MKLITDEMIVAAKTRAEESAAALVTARTELGAGTIGPQTAQNYAVATAQSERDAATVVMLSDQQSAQRVELQARSERERHIWAELDAAERELGASAARTAQSVTTAQAALLAAIDAAAAHDAAVGRARQLMLAHRLGLGDVATDAEHDSGAGERHGLRLRGRHWHQVDPGSVLSWLVGRAGRAAFGAAWSLGRRGVAELERSGLFDDVAELPVRPQPPRLRIPTVRLGRAEPALGPGLNRAEVDRLLHPRAVA